MSGDYTKPIGKASRYPGDNIILMSEARARRGLRPHPDRDIMFSRLYRARFGQAPNRGRS